MSLLFGSLFAAKVDFDMGLGMMRMFCFTHVYMIPLWMIVFTWGNAGGVGPALFSFLYSFPFFSFLPRSFMGGLVFSLFFGGYRSSVGLLTTLFSSLGFGFLNITYKHWHWVWDFGLTSFFYLCLAIFMGR